MRRLSPLTLVALLLLQTLAVGMAAPASAASARGGPSDDFFVTGISVGNASNAADVWVQSDGTTVDYIFQGESIEVTMTIQRGGSSLLAKTTDAMLQIVHPIGFVVETYTWSSGDLSGGQGDSASFVWTATDAHSILNTSTNDLSGGMILRAMTDKDSNGDTLNENDMMEMSVPVAIMSDVFDGTAGTGETPSFPAAIQPPVETLRASVLGKLILVAQLVATTGQTLLIPTAIIHQTLMTVDSWLLHIRTTAVQGQLDASLT